MAITQIDTKPASKPETKVNGNTKPSVESDATEAKRRGRVATMPACILYRLGGKVHAVIHSPLDGSSYAESGKGEGSAKGALEDSGFRIGEVFDDGPEWLDELMPAGAELIGFAKITGFPLPQR